MPFHRFQTSHLLPTRRSLGRWAAATLCLLALGSCMEPTGEGGTPRPAGLVIHSRLPAASQFQSAVLAVEQVHVTVTTKPDTAGATRRLLNQNYPFNVNSTSITLSLPVFVSQAAETLDVHLDYRTSSGQTLFTALTQAIVIAGSSSEAEGDFSTNYVGPGTNVAFMNITPRDTTIVGGTTAQFTAFAYDSQEANVPEVYLSWYTSDTSVHINALGLLTAPLNRNVTVTVYAYTPTGIGDQTTLTIVPQGSAPLNGRVIDAATGAAVAGATLTFKDVTGLVVTTTTTAADGSFVTTPLPGGVYTGDVGAVGYIGTVVFDARPATGGTTIPTIPLVPAGSNGGGVFGRITDARTALALQGVTVELRDGVDNTTGTIVQSTTTDTGGNYILDPPPGTYTLLAHFTGYVDGRFVFGNASGASNQNLSLSPTGASEVRIVLQWGATPPDLDAHLTGPDQATPGTRFHVYFGGQGNLNADPFAALDVDNTSGFGPETITITQQAAGVYRFSVHDYTDSDLNPSDSLANSGARVDLYINGSLQQQFFVPNQPGTLWEVFELNGSVVTAKNVMSYQQNSDAVTAPGVPTGSLADRAMLWHDILAHHKR
jgi:hypothetical protein